MARRSTLLFPLSLLLAWLFDFLFWDKAVGISFPIFILLALGLGFFFAWRTGVKAAPGSLWLLLPITFFAAISALRLEPMTLLLSRALALFFMALLATSFLGGRWARYNLGDYLVKLLSFIPSGYSGWRKEEEEASAAGEARFRLGRLAPVLRGLLIALPVLWVLGALLAEADPIFSTWLTNLLSVFNIDDLGEYLFRGFYIIILAYLLVGIYFYALRRSQDEKLFGEDKPLLQPFLGFGETATVMVAVELLFVAFVVVQFRYFFGGDANVSVVGYTYAEYARRGFMELVAVAVLSLLLFLGLANLGKREAGNQQRAFSGLGIALMALVSVMLVSAYQRLLLYESAYGFTSLRTYAHTFMVWLGLLLLAVVVLELLGRRRAFVLAILAAAVGLSASLSLLNVDRFIVTANLQRARQGYALDMAHLGRLSVDAAAPLMAEYAQANADGAPALAAQVATALACNAAQNDYYAPQPAWQSWHRSRAQARQGWLDLHQDPGFQALHVSVVGDLRDGFIATVNGESFDCWDYSDFD